jgi:hypothetical protein
MKRQNIFSTLAAGCAFAGCAIALVGAASAQSVKSGKAAFGTSLTGAAVLPGPADPDGSGTARVTFVEGEQNVCFELSVSNIQTATMAHIHGGTATEVGGPPLFVMAPPVNGESKGCASAPQRLVDAIKANPANFFVTIHNAEFPGGAVRGQLGG